MKRFLALFLVLLLMLSLTACAVQSAPANAYEGMEPAEAAEAAAEATKDNTGLHFQIAINYGGRDEIRRAVTNLAEQVQAGTLQPEEITEEKISAALDTAGIPEPDLLIRTCNELRISNFLLWQLAYTEFYFTPVAWPDFSKAELEKAIEAYNHRDRRYGLVKEE